MTQSALYEYECIRQQGQVMAALPWDTWASRRSLALAAKLPEDQVEPLLLLLQRCGMVEDDGKGRYRKRAVRA